jgi:lipoate---protein ligase
MYDVALRAAGTEPAVNLALEESLLERGIGQGAGDNHSGRSRESAILVYVNDPCVVVGRNQNPWTEVSAGSGLPVLRRVSGGGAVYHDRGNLNWSLIVPRSRHDRGAELALVARALEGLGIETEPGPRGGLFVAAAGPWKGAKVSGTARRISATRVLHHGTLLVDADLRALSACLGGIEAELSRALPSVRSPSVNLSCLVPGLRVEDALRAIARELSGGEPLEAEGFADRAYAEEAAVRLSSWEWTWGSTPAFSLGLPWSGGLAHIEVKSGIVASASGQGAESLSSVLGRRFGYELPSAALLALEGGGPSFS